MSRGKDETGRGKPAAGSEPLTPSELFASRAERIARSAQSVQSARPNLASPGDSEVGRPVRSEAYDAVPFGLRRRIPARFAIPEAEALGMADPGSTDHIARQKREIDRVRKACLKAAKDLQSQMQAIDAELSRASSAGQEDRVHAEPVPAPCGKVMSGGNEGSF